MLATISYEKLQVLLNKKGETLHSLKQDGVITDYQSRLMQQNKSVSLDTIAKLCDYFKVNIEDLVTISIDEE